MKINKKLLAAAAFAAGSVLPDAAAGCIKNITARNGISLNLNGENVVPMDAFGKQLLYSASTMPGSAGIK